MKKSVAETTLAIAKKREREYLKETKDGIIAKIQMDLDEYASRQEKWPYIQQHTSEVDSRCYNRQKFPGRKYSDQQLQSILNQLGFRCDFGSDVVYISIPMWRKGVKKTTAQLMLYHHLNSVNKAMKEEKEGQEAAAKKDFQDVISQLESGDFESKLSDDGNGYDIKVKLEEGERRGTHYGRKLKKLLEKRGFKWGRFLYRDDNTMITDGFVLYLPKKK